MVGLLHSHACRCSPHQLNSPCGHPAVHAQLNPGVSNSAVQRLVFVQLEPRLFVMLQAGWRWWRSRASRCRRRQLARARSPTLKTTSHRPCERRRFSLPPASDSCNALRVLFAAGVSRQHHSESGD